MNAKNYAAIGLTLLLIAALSGGVQAKVTGYCSNCHTMHNSQDLNAVAKVWSGGALTTSAAPVSYLLTDDCVGCHSRSDTQTIDAYNTPIIFNTGGYPPQPLAGGNFYGAAGDGTTKHNVSPIYTSSPLATPPGFKALGGSDVPTGFTAAGSGWGPTTWSGQVTCSGVNGCHGDRSLSDVYRSMGGAHHTDNSTINGSSVGKSYRFLAGIKGAQLDTNGGTDYRWQKNSDSTHHNGYYGNTGGDKNTISYLCGECHANFHMAANLGGSAQVGTASPWLRHPADSYLTASGSSPFSTDYTTYNPQIPMAYATPSTTNSTVNSSSIVMCLSCHVAHGSPYYKLLRWDVRNGTLLTAISGCITCHKGKD